MSEAEATSGFTLELRRHTRGTLHSIRFIAAILLEQRALLGISALLLLLSSSVMVVGPRLIGMIVDRVTTAPSRDGLYVLIMLYAGSELLRLVSSAAHSYSIARLGQASLHTLRTRVFNQITHLPMKLHDRAKTGELMTFISNDVQALSDMFSAGFMVVVEKFLVVIFTVVSLFLLSSKLAFIGLGLFFILFFLAILFGRLLKGIYRDLREANSIFNSSLSENIDGIAITRLNGFERHRLNRYSESVERLRAAQLAPIKVFGAFHPSVTVVNALSIAALGIYGGEMVISGEITLGILVAALGYVLWLFWPIIIIVDRWNTFLNGLSATERLVALLALSTEESTVKSRQLPQPVRGEIVFEDVWFAYQGEDWVIRGLTMRIPAGSKVAFFGPTGSGKTTLTSLLLRFYEPQKGKILIDGVDIRELSLAELREAFGVVQQDAVLYDGTVEENITLFSHLEEQSLPPGLSVRTDLARKATSSLSMGERQVIAFERARMHSPALWILDEATAHLDPALDRALEDALIQESQSRTVIIIAHRLSSLVMVDRIMVLSRGTVLETGSHAELMAANGFYARYIQLQSDLDRESARIE